MIDREQIRKVAQLARLELTEAEEEQFTPQLNSILEYFEQLSELDTEGIAPTTRAIELSNVTRPDQVNIETEPKILLEVAPEIEGDYFRVPRILTSET